MSLRGFRRGVAALLSAVAILCLPVTALAAPAARVQTDIVGGHSASITQFPWQVYLALSGPGASCGGSILDATHVLTAAHCIDLDGTATPRPAADVKVLAGFSNVSSYFQGTSLPAGAQVAAVSSVRVHPYYNPITFADDVAVLTLAKPLTFSSSVRAISLGTVPAAGAAVTISGYGQVQASTEAEPSLANTSLNWTTQQLLSEDAPACASTEANSAVMSCASSPTSAPCFGDSGGPLVAGNPAVEIGVVSHFSAAGLCTASPTVYTNVAAPEVRDFIDGSSTPPVAPRPMTEPQISGVSPTVDYSPLSCSAGTWSGAPSIAYSFETTAGTLADPLQAGPSNTFTPTAAQVGERISCTVIATNAGGTSVARFDLADPIVADTVPPKSQVLARRCQARICSVTVRAVDPNSLGSVRVRATLRYTTTRVRCVRARHHHRKRCTTKHVQHTVPASVANTAPHTYRVRVRNMPFGSSRLTITAIDAAGNRQKQPIVIRFSTRRPKKHPAHARKKHHTTKHR